MGAKFKASNQRRKQLNYTVNECIEGYISSKEKVLSPSTIKGYRQIQATRFKTFGRLYVKKLGNEEVQRWVSDMSGLSPKSVQNIYGLFSVSIAFYFPDMKFKVSLPRQLPKRRKSPESEAVIALVSMASPNLKKAIVLAAFCSLRRSEICAVEYADLKGNQLYIHRGTVQDDKGNWITKDYPKTSESIRLAPVPEGIASILGHGEGLIVPVLPSTITTEFIRIRNRLGLDIRFHDLRHYFASLCAVLNIPMNYTEAFGGWRQGSTVLRDTYINVMESQSAKYASEISNTFEKYATKYATELKKPPF